jgi:hypothetical protein
MKRRDLLKTSIVVGGVSVLGNLVQGAGTEKKDLSDLQGPRKYVKGAEFYDLLPEGTRPDEQRDANAYVMGKGPDSDKMLIPRFAWRGRAIWLGVTQAKEQRLQFEKMQQGSIIINIFLKLALDDEKMIDRLDLEHGDEVEFFGVSADKKAITSPSELRVKLEDGMLQIYKLSVDRAAREERERKYQEQVNAAKAAANEAKARKK